MKRAVCGSAEGGREQGTHRFLLLAAGRRFLVARLESATMWPLRVGLVSASVSLGFDLYGD